MEIRKDTIIIITIIILLAILAFSSLAIINNKINSCGCASDSDEHFEEVQTYPESSMTPFDRDRDIHLENALKNTGEHIQTMNTMCNQNTNPAENYARALVLSQDNSKYDIRGYNYMDYSSGPAPYTPVIQSWNSQMILSKNMRGLAPELTKVTNIPQGYNVSFN